MIHQKIISGHQKVKYQKKKRKKKLLSTVHNFNKLIEKMPKLKVNQKSLLKNKFKNFKLKNKHIFFYFKKNKLVLVYKKYIFKNGISIIKTLLSQNIKNIKKKEKIKIFYKLMF